MNQEFRSEQLGELKRLRKEDKARKKDFEPFELAEGPLVVYLARHFGFCFGVDRAVEIAYRALEEQTGAVYLLSEMIHNPAVNADLLSRGVRFLCDTSGNELISLSTLNEKDTVILPAFGVSLEMEERLRAQSINVERYDTTCPFVERVWKRARQLGEKGYTIIIHGKPHHEETRATFSRAAQYGPVLVIRTVVEALLLAEIIRGERPLAEFSEYFGDRCSVGFDCARDLQRLGVVNQTTMLAEETAHVAEILKQAVEQREIATNAAESVIDVFADTRDTLCYATSDNQNSVKTLLERDADLAIVIGGFNSSNTTHLAKLCSRRFVTFHIRGVADIKSVTQIVCRDMESGQEKVIEGWLPEVGVRALRVALTAGASTPDASVEEVIHHLRDLLS